MIDWKAMKTAAASSEEDMARQAQEYKDELGTFRQEMDDLNKEARKGTVTYGLTGAAVSPLVYWGIQKLLGKKATPTGLALTAGAGYLAGSGGKSYYNQTRPDFRTRKDNTVANLTHVANKLQTLDLIRAENQVRADLDKQATKSGSDLMSKIARDVSGRYEEHLKRNAAFLKGSVLGGKTVEVFAPDGTPGIVRGEQWHPGK